ncbi:hypothetical protein JCM10213_002320 [Rhodosporidiobolus nylandii]
MSNDPTAGPSSAAASTSTSSTAAPRASLSEGKRKRLPACDTCKLRRLKCDPVPPPASCPRCKATGVVCTTTPTQRKKAAPRVGKRIEEAKATFGTADPNTDGLMGASNSPWVGRAIDGSTTLATGIRQPDLAEGDAEGRLVGQEMNGALVAHLLELYQAIPQSWLPIGVRGRTLLQFEAAGRRLENLSPQMEVLARVTIALTSRLSSHPALFSPSPSDPATPIPAFESLTPEYLATHRDLREFGQRREAACEGLRRRAVQMAWERGTLVETSEETMASCYLLEMLEGRKDPAAGKPYGSAFVSHLQTILNQQDQPGATLKVQNSSLAWSALIMREALYAANAGRTSHFTATDDRLLCGEVPVSIEEALMETVDDVDVRDSVTLFFRPMRPYTYHCARLARECSEQLTGTFARRQPFNEQYYSKFLTQMDHLIHLFAILESRIAFVLSPAAASAHSLPAPFETERQFIMRACLYTLSIAWSSLCLPVWVELSRRISSLREPPPTALPAHAVNERHRLLERLTLLQQQMHGNVLKAARMFAQTVQEAPSLAFLTHLQSESYKEWVEILIQAVPVEEGGSGITREEREGDLRWMLDGLKTMGWSWSDNGPLISTIEEALGEMSIEDRSVGAAEAARPQVSLELPTPAPLFASSSAGEQPAFLAAQSQNTPAFPVATPQPAAEPPFDPLSFLAGSAEATPPPAASSATAPAPSPVPDLSALPSLFTGVPAPSSAAAPVLAPPAAPSASSADAAAAIPDIATLISLYTSGALQPIIDRHGLNVAQLAGQFMLGTLDLPALLESMGGPAALAELGLGLGSGAEQAEGREARQEELQSQADGGGFDLEALLAEPLFGAEGMSGEE